MLLIDILVANLKIYNAIAFVRFYWFLLIFFGDLFKIQILKTLEFIFFLHYT